MKKLIITLIFLGSILPKVWGNEGIGLWTKNQDYLMEYQFNDLKLNNSHDFHHSSTDLLICSNIKTNLLINKSISFISEKTTYCNNSFESSNTTIGLRFHFKQRNNEHPLVVTLQGGISTGIRQFVDDQGIKRIKIHANIGNDYDHQSRWFSRWNLKVSGEYKFSFRYSGPEKKDKKDDFLNQTTTHPFAKEPRVFRIVFKITY
jgi:hypothetical protein